MNIYGNLSKYLNQGWEAFNSEKETKLLRDITDTLIENGTG